MCKKPVIDSLSSPDSPPWRWLLACGCPPPSFTFYTPRRLLQPFGLQKRVSELRPYLLASPPLAPNGNLKRLKVYPLLSSDASFDGSIRNVQGRNILSLRLPYPLIHCIIRADTDLIKAKSLSIPRLTMAICFNPEKNRLFLNKKVKEYLVVLSIFDSRRIVWHLQMLAMASHLPCLYHGSPRLNLRPREL